MPEQPPTSPNKHANAPQQPIDAHAAAAADAHNAGAERSTGAGSEANPYDNLPHPPNDAHGEVF